MTAKKPSSQAARPKAARKTATPPRTPASAKAKARSPRAKKKAPSLVETAVTALENLKAHNIKVIDVTRLTDVADTMIIASGTSDRHVKSLAGNVVDEVEKAGFRALGVEGESEGEWVLVDLQDVIVHVMLPRIREFYGLEKLWEPRGAQREAATA